jgi:hypothetical protein
MVPGLVNRAVHQKTEAKRMGSAVFSQMQTEATKTGITFNVFISPNNHPLPLS